MKSMNHFLNKMTPMLILCIALLGFIYDVKGMINDSGEIVFQEYLRWSYTHMNPTCTSAGGGRNPCQDIRVCKFAVASLAMGGWPTLCGWVGKGVPKVCCGLPLVWGPRLMKIVEEQKARKRDCGTTTILPNLSRRENYFFKIVRNLPDIKFNDPMEHDPPLDLDVEPMISSARYAGSRQGKFPWMVSIRKDGFHICGGTLISRKHILTAAYCFQTTDIEDLQSHAVHIGNLFVDDGFAFNISNVTIHPEYESGKIYKNLALLTLSNEILSTAVPHICLPGPELTNNHIIGKPTTWLRWGKTIEGNESKTILYITDDQTIIPPKECIKLFAGLITEEMADDFICTETRRSNKNECEEDYGGPLMYKSNVMNLPTYDPNIPWVLLGVDTFGPMCFGKKSAGLFTRVSSHMKWIVDSMNE